MRAILITMTLLLASNGYAQGRLAQLLSSRLALPRVAQVPKFFLQGAALVLFSCAPLSCGLHTHEPPPVAVQQSNTQYFFADKNIHFRHEGRSYRGDVVEILDDERSVIVQLHDGRELLVAFANISGARLDKHELLFAQVRAPMQERALRYVEGRVVGIYSDGYAAVQVLVEIDRQYHKNKITQPYELFFPIRELTLLSERRAGPVTMAAR